MENKSYVENAKDWGFEFKKVKLTCKGFNEFPRPRITYLRICFSEFPFLFFVTTHIMVA